MGAGVLGVVFGAVIAITIRRVQGAAAAEPVRRRPLLQLTGLSERFDFNLEWKPNDPAVDPSAAPAAEFAPSLLAALDEQLGLKLEAQRAPMDYFVIDSAEPPTDN
jgi:uncharacterized protein (TIGR03435 family)